MICILCVDLICGLNDKFKRRDTQHPLVINPNCLRPTVGGGGGGARSIIIWLVLFLTKDLLSFTNFKYIRHLSKLLLFCMHY